MRKLTLSFLFVFVTTIANAEILKIESIDRGDGYQQSDLIFLSDGRVAFAAPGAIDRFNIDQFLIGRDQHFSIKLDRHHNLISLQPLEHVTSAPTNDSPSLGGYVADDYEPTVLPSLAEVESIFKKMNRRWQEDSQCYNRAHVWNYEEFRRSGLLSKKVFIFYTRRYIRNYRFKWWFHAIPTVLANHEGTIVERALDPMFAKKALPMKEWTDIFIKTRRVCPTITKYSTYRDNQETEDCYLHFSTMYFWQPRDLDRLERTGAEKKDFIQSEVRHAYWEAF